MTIGYRCIQGYPDRVCSGCTTACNEPIMLLNLWAETTDIDKFSIRHRGDSQIDLVCEGCNDFAFRHRGVAVPLIRLVQAAGRHQCEPEAPDGRA